MKKIGKIAKAIIIILLAIVLIVNISIIIQTKTNPDSVPSIFGYKPFIVLSGSMESQINVGDLVIVKNIAPSNLQIGDIIAFRDSENTVTTHRIVDIRTENDNLCFTTKGDANNVNDDDTVYANQVEGIYQTKFAQIGNAILFIQEPAGFATMMMLIFLICILIYLYQNRKNDDKKAKFKNAEERRAFEEFMKERAQRQLQNDNK